MIPYNTLFEFENPYIVILFYMFSNTNQLLLSFNKCGI